MDNEKEIESLHNNELYKELMELRNKNDELERELKLSRDVNSLKGQMDEKRDISFQSLTFSKLILATRQIGGY